MGVQGPGDPDPWDLLLCWGVFVSVLCGVLSFVQLVSN